MFLKQTGKGIVFGGDRIIPCGKGGVDYKSANTKCHDQTKDNLADKKLGRKIWLARTARFKFVIYSTKKMVVSLGVVGANP
jgi:hypothetical protein